MLKDLDLATKKGDKVWVQFLNSKGELIAVITSDKNRETYYLHKVVDGRLVKTRYKNRDPTELEKYVYGKDKK